MDICHIAFDSVQSRSYVAQQAILQLLRDQRYLGYVKLHSIHKFINPVLDPEFP